MVALHFCTQQNSRSLDPQEFVASVVAQLAARMPGYADAVAAKSPDVARPTGSDAFRARVIEATRRLAEPRKQFLIVVDALDEAMSRNGETIVDVIVHDGSIRAHLDAARPPRRRSPHTQRQDRSHGS